MCQAEVAHHANKSPEYLISRPEKYVHLYKKALALNIKPCSQEASTREDQDWWDWCDDCERNNQMWQYEASGPAVAAVAPRVKKQTPRHTKPSDIQLYENRMQYWFWPEGTPISPLLPARATPEEQVAAVNLWDFFRLVRFRGGQTPYLEWYEENCWPIVVMSPIGSRFCDSWATTTL